MIFDRRRYRKDNYVYLLAEGDDAAWIDPGDPEVALVLAAAHGVRPRWILHTHGHADHTGGSARLREEAGARVLGHGADAAWFAPDEDLSGRAEVALGALRLEVVPVPGHTPGSVVLTWRGRAFTGDTLFWGGCGNCRHGGDVEALARSLTGPVAALPGALLVHPGHDYGELNLPFGLALEPGNARTAERLAAVRAARAAGREPEPSTLEEERAVNPFLRADVPTVRDAVRVRAPGTAEDAASGVAALRRIRDTW